MSLKRDYFELHNGFLYKEDSEWKYQQLDEIDIKKWIVIGGVTMLLFNWLAKSYFLMKKMGVKYGDRVRKVEKDSFGKMTDTKGLLVKKDGHAQVFTRSDKNIIRFVKWDADWKKDK
jgi:hypothetical protein